MSEIIKGSVNVKSFLVANGDGSTGVLAKTGDITATTGDITATAGDITATAGNVVVTAATKGIVHTNSDSS